ncbi:Ribosome bioproteinsis protein erb1 [Orbilia oligospora]|uniref:Ribosome biogenesis protein ERB1 n=1 Tax=Orbilia oligospora TaxID=2813651 RepID=A0A7C8JZC0_ORBOL|nr:Ribosome bioproteinsis protein erb1 [Orbilia oligospora]KAF3193225.1 Ribosome bioproteinsis protein erb1 [Orbilia oligospora]KAF3246574.1 Ribosome bioproteinsis protein erb1 [Orbilia oligospora]KAF3271695.1 Ribosome bioproteinsis protein erb1 [Orbilia oligospora]TGJ72553.1 Ribosome bioproteinsis protein erb1 [Orbilia oligospora]
MPTKVTTRKRSRPEAEAEKPVLSSEDEFEIPEINGDEDSSDDSDFTAGDEDSDEEEEFSSGAEDEEEEQDIDSDEIPSEDEASPKENGTADHDASGDEEAEPADNVKVVTGADGNPRYIYPEIEPVYDSDDTDAEETNTIGNIPLEYYENYPHVGYDINGKRIMRPAAGKALDTLLDSIELPKGWTGLVDKNSGAALNLTEEELEIVKKLQRSEITDEGFDPYPDMVEWFSSKVEQMPLSSAPEPKRRFVPSKHEQKRIMKIVKGIREGRILPHKPQAETSQEPEFYDIWADDAPPKPDHVMNIPAPKLPPPTHDESYNPPPEYLPNDKERKEWEEQDPEDRDKNYLPRTHKALRLVPGFNGFISERFERCLDLYLAPRVRRNKLNIDPASLLPKLPSPDDLKPFPTTCATVYRGHEGRVRSVAADPTGVWVATGGDDGTIRVWEILTGRQVWKLKVSSDEAVDSVTWRPTTEGRILAAACGNEILLVVPPIFDFEEETQGKEILSAGFGYAANRQGKKEAPGIWSKPDTAFEEEGVVVTITVRKTVKYIAWHRRGDYLVTVSPEDVRRAVCIHRVSTHLSQTPFKEKSVTKGIPQRVQFHPSKPLLFVATKRYIKIYDLAKAELSKTLKPGARWISSIDIHPQGDNLIVGSYDKRLLWHDLDLSTKPYRTLRYHDKGIRAVSFHRGGFPLFCSSSDDGTVQVFHGRIYSDLMENALIVPLKVLKGHKITAHLGVLDVDWHPKQPWLFSAGADGTARLWN